MLNKIAKFAYNVRQIQLNVNFYKEQLEAKEDMLAMTTKFLVDMQQSLEERNKELSETHKEIFDSVKFAGLIQKSLLPDVNVLKVFLKDVVFRVIQQISIGGDTVFIKNTNKGVMFGLLDATGHGIPGAMLSIAGSLMLNELTSSMEIDNPKILTKLFNYQLYNTFNRDSYSIGHMEGTICYFSPMSNKLIYCSAKGKGFHIPFIGNINPLSNTKNAIGDNSAEEFENFEININKGDKIVLYSDGLVDQFGGESNKKFSRERLRKLLIENRDKNVKEMAVIIENESNMWKGSNAQTDDISFKLVEF
ncbi:MAG: SpoIIE family protein phosphatase [Bacteroidetes bacterium]|nr:SpoIIE family protein phosphatase [Bacteroidota bacterium]